jgi:hypothetical protein
MPAAGRNGGVKSGWLRDNPPENPLGTEELPSWMRSGRGQGEQREQREQRRPRTPRQDPGDAMDTRARSVRSGRGRPRDYDEYDGYDDQQGYDAGYEDDDDGRSNGRKRGGFFGFFGRK